MAKARAKTALVLASGGIAGVSYEVGALRALDHVLLNRTVNDFDIFVGTSAGAVVSACLASGMPPIMLAGLIAGTVPGFQTMGRSQLYRPNLAEAAQRLSQAPRLVRDAALEYWRFRDRVPLSEAIYSLTPLIPSGIFTNDGIEGYLRQTFAKAGLSDDFRDVPKELHVVAADIDNDERVAFSRFSHPEVPISKAVSASTAIPVLFRPVEIGGHFYVDGGIKGQAAVDIAISRGAKLIVVINGLVPLDTPAISKRATTARARHTIMDLGLRAIYNQVVRGMLHDSLIDHIRMVRDKHPDVDILLIEPMPDDEKMFFHEVMSFSARLIVLQHGYETVTTGLHGLWPYLSKILPKYGIEITREVLDRKPPELPVEEMERRIGVLGRLRHTVLDRRGVREAEPASKLTVPRIRKPAVEAVAPEPPVAPAPKRARAAAAGGSQARRTPPRGRGAFRPRVISSDGGE
ncbi:MAG TPA: patatin-like phospholipase family protein [Candidatus Dormibacteraeota bacterium]|jgi:predicted acylesterase/phospholipase RssA|nr:patatin-like phospholipase family protein [Candidatus Dormibacteraeota bacterium]